MKISSSIIAVAALFAVSAQNSPLAAAVITFEELSLGASSDGIDGDGSSNYSGGGYYWNGSNSAGSFTSGGITFRNSYNTTYDSWDGFAYSNTTDATTVGWGNQYSVVTGGGAGIPASGKYAIAYYSAYANQAPTITFDAPTSLLGASAQITNTTYAYLDMISGSTFSKKFGGATGNDPDFLKLTATGYNGANTTGTIDFFLADLTFEDNSKDYILTNWTTLDLSRLGTVTSIAFTMDSSDKSFGYINTPTYFAIDNLVIPEPSAWLFVASLSPMALRRRRDTNKECYLTPTR